MELHPDRNKEDAATAAFLRVGHAYDILGNSELRAKLEGNPKVFVAPNPRKMSDYDRDMFHSGAFGGKETNANSEDPILVSENLPEIQTLAVSSQPDPKIKTIYAKATPLIKCLKTEPGDPKLKDRINDLNNEILNHIIKYADVLAEAHNVGKPNVSGFDEEKKKEKLRGYWRQIHDHLNIDYNNLRISFWGLINAKNKEAYDGLKYTINKLIHERNYPKEWSITNEFGNHKQAQPSSSSSNQYQSTVQDSSSSLNPYQSTVEDGEGHQTADTYTDTNPRQLSYPNPNNQESHINSGRLPYPNPNNQGQLSYPEPNNQESHTYPGQLFYPERNNQRSQSLDRPSNQVRLQSMAEEDNVEMAYSPVSNNGQMMMAGGKNSMTATESANKGYEEIWKPGLTWDCKPILALRNIGRGYQFLVQEGTVQSPKYTLLDSTECGRKAADAYKAMTKKCVLGGKGAEDRFSHKDCNRFQRLLGVAAKPIETMSINATRVPLPVTFVLVQFLDEQVWLTRTTLRKILGKPHADGLIQKWYRAHSITPAEDLAPTRIRLSSKNGRYNLRSKDLDDPQIKIESPISIEQRGRDNAESKEHHPNSENEKQAAHIQMLQEKMALMQEEITALLRRGTAP
ncbi:MAG: hypothetical protein M1816_005717 [Peltula sp. TS41687]|nr:MAG: hypothetical protein M1816_005717 [Peltula sp. TS41687]